MKSIKTLTSNSPENTLLALQGIEDVRKCAACIQHHINLSHTRIGATSDRIVAIVKGVFDHSEQRYAQLYREKRKGKQFVDGHSIKFFCITGDAYKLNDTINAIFGQLEIDAVATVLRPTEQYVRPVDSIVIKSK